jgi:hypothetical protein
VEESIDAELERLGDLRSAAEDLLMECPSPDASAFATKYLVAHAGGRDIDAWGAIFEAEARQFADLASAVSPVMQTAVDRWVETSLACRAHAGTDDEATPLHDADLAAAQAVAMLPAQSPEELLIKLYMLALVECGQVGPGELKYDRNEECEETILWNGIVADLPRLSPAVRALIERGRAA